MLKLSAEAAVELTSEWRESYPTDAASLSSSGAKKKTSMVEVFKNILEGDRLPEPPRYEAEAGESLAVKPETRAFSSGRIFKTGVAQVSLVVEFASVLVGNMFCDSSRVFIGYSRFL